MGVSTSNENPLQKSYEYINVDRCCGCQLEQDGKRSLIAPADHGKSASRQWATSEARTSTDSRPSTESRPPSTDKRVTFQLYNSHNEDCEDHQRTPDGWTESEMLLLKREVEKVARTLRVKPPGFSAMQAIRGSNPIYVCTDTIAPRPFLAPRSIAPTPPYFVPFPPTT
jgi:hypothetical protein